MSTLNLKIATQFETELINNKCQIECHAKTPIYIIFFLYLILCISRVNFLRVHFSEANKIARARSVGKIIFDSLSYPWVFFRRLFSPVMVSSRTDLFVFFPKCPQKICRSASDSVLLLRCSERVSLRTMMAGWILNHGWCFYIYFVSPTDIFELGRVWWPGVC